MSEISMYDAQVRKMQGLCDEHNLVYRFRKDQYPITFTIKAAQTMDAQMSMLEEVEENGFCSPSASMTWTFGEDGVLDIKVRGGTFTISKTLRTKIENILMKMIAFWQRYFFRNIMERGILAAKDLPVYDDEEYVPEGAEPYADDEENEDSGGPDDESGDDAAAGSSTGGVAGNGASGEGGEPSDGDPAASAGSALVSLDDPEVREAVRVVRAANKASCALLQRQMGIKAAKAVRLMEALETLGVVGPFNGSSPREVLPCDEPDDEPEAQAFDEA